MTGLLSIDRELGRILCESSARRESGVVTAMRGKLKRLFCLDRGFLAFAVSNVVEEQLAHGLLRSKRLTTQELRVAQEACGRQQELKLSLFLVEFGALTAEEMEQRSAAHVRELLFTTLDWADGQCSFERGQPDLEGEFTVHARSVELLLDYARSRPLSIDATRMRIGPPSVAPIPSPESEQLLADLSLEPQLRYVMGQSNGERSLGKLVDLSPHPPEESWRAIYALVLAGALEPRGVRREQAAVSATVTRDELTARLDRARDSTHYAVLELGPTATAEEIRDTYYFLARRYHPDRYRTGPMQDLLDQIEAYFAQVTEAYNTLSDPAMRGEYDAEIAETAPKKAEQNTRDLARQNYALALSLIERGRYTDAVTSLENAIQLDGTQAKYYLELGRLQARNPRHRQSAEEYLIRANEIDPALADGYYALGDLYARTNRAEDAARLFREALRWEPDHIAAAEKLKELGEGGRRGLFGG